MYAGRIVEKAPSGELFDAPRHPYTRGLIGALPPLDGARRRLTAIPGTVPDPRDMPAGCAFAPRCSTRVAVCQAAPPPLVPVGAGRRRGLLTSSRRNTGSKPRQAAE